MDFLQSLLDSSEIPVVTAFLLGLLTAVSPCPLATNITAMGFISKDISTLGACFATASSTPRAVWWLTPCLALCS